MKKLLVFIYFFYLLGSIVACSRGPTDIIFEAGGKKYEWVEYAKSIPGRFLITPNNPDTDHPYGSLLEFDSHGKVLYFKKPELDHQKGIVDFRQNSQGFYSFFLIQNFGKNWVNERDQGIFSFHLLTSSFEPVQKPFIPTPSNDLDMHDVIISSRGNYVFLYYPKDPVTKTTEAEIREINPQGQLIFTWNSRNLFQEERNHRKESDFLHLNSVFEDRDGGFILSFCNTSEIIKIRYPTGALDWIISPRDWKFVSDDQNGFGNQHTPTMLKNGNLLMYDNNYNEQGHSSRAVEYRLDFKKKIAYLQWQFKAQAPFTFWLEKGGVERLSNGNTLISWGSLGTPWQKKYQPKVPIFTEVSPDGKKVRELSSQSGQESYRAHFIEDQKPIIYSF